MGLESFSYITSLNASNPVGATDLKQQGDDHIRGLKTTLLNSFPNVAGAVTLTHTQLNDAGLKSAANTWTDTNGFAAITATSYDGVAAANLIDKTAAEVVTGAWDFETDQQISKGGYLRFYGPGDSGYFSIKNDDTDINFTHSGITDWNISGITAINAGTVDADFDAVTATTYDGVAAANLVDKSATETISGAWTFSSAIAAYAYGSVLEGNLLDKSAPETISGAGWVFSNHIQVAGLNVGHASDTTITRDAAGQIAVEGDAVLTHNDGAYTSAKVFFSNSTEPTTEGNNGDIFLVY